MEITNKNIEAYILRFMEGETTNAEEQAIYRFFRKGDVPEHLKHYSDMFLWYEEGMPQEAKPKALSIWKRLPLEIKSMGIAAMLTLSIGLGILHSLEDRTNEDWSCYQGSYVEVNGKRITDIETILPIIHKTLAEAEAIEKSIEEQLAAFQRTEEEIAKREELFNDERLK